jgi:hypothetical protein
MYEWFWKHYAHSEEQRASDMSEGILLLSLWADHLHRPADEASVFFPGVLRQVRGRYMAAEWWAVYDFVEFVVHCERPWNDTTRFIAECNAVLEKHLSAYRFVGATLAPVTSEDEIVAVEQAMSRGGKFKPIVADLETALARLADRASPDYRNSIKESISAVEAVCQIITGDPKATLGQALKKIGIHPALEKASRQSTDTQAMPTASGTPYLRSRPSTPMMPSSF